MLLKTGRTVHGTALLQREATFFQQFSPPQLPCVYELSQNNDDPARVLEDHGGEPLRAALTESSPDVAQVLQFGHRCAALLAELHRANIIVQNLTPGSFLWNGRPANSP